MEQKNNLAGILIIPALAIAYYFGIALPENQKAHLDFEKQKYEAEQKKQKEVEEKLELDKASSSLSLVSCLGDAVDSYWSYVKLNGRETPGKPGTYTASISTWNIADRNKKDAIEECHRRYGK